MENKNKKKAENKILKRIFFVLPIIFIGLVFILAPIHTAGAQDAITNNAVGQLAVGAVKTVAAFVGATAINFGYWLLGKIAFFIGFLIAWICGIFIGVETWLIGVVLNMNDNVFQSAVVQTGFSVSLSLANLGFVFGIIIIAIATILRNQTYGIKQILWKLVVMAILVNFGLVIMGFIFNFADQFTTYFLSCIDPSGGCGTAQSFTAAFHSENDFASSLAGAFNPQKDLLSWNNLNATGTTADSLDSMSGVGSDIGKMLVPIFSLFFIAASLIVIIITLAVFIFMLLVRYVYIAILAVLLPFAWMLWVFPKTKENFDKWWHKFIQWTLFAPIVLFFLWLAITTAHGLSNNATGTQSFAMYNSASAQPLKGISDLLGDGFSPIIQNILNEIVLVGLMVGGMIAANSLGIAGASATLALGKTVGTRIGKAAGNYGLNQGKKGLRAAAQKAGAGRLTQKLQEHQGFGIPGSKYLTKNKEPIRIGGGAMSSLGRGLASATEAGGKDLVEQSMAGTRGKDPKRLSTELKGKMGKQDQFAWLRAMADSNSLSMVENVGGQKLADFMDSNGLAIDQYGQGKLAGDFDAATGSNKVMREAQRQIDLNKGSEPMSIEKVENGKRTTPTPYSSANDALKEGVDKFMEGFDPNKIDPKLMFSKAATAAAKEAAKGNNPNSLNALLENIAEKQPHNIPKMIPKMKGAELNNFKDLYVGEGDENDGGVLGEKRKKRIKEIDESQAGEDKEAATGIFDGVMEESKKAKEELDAIKNEKITTPDKEQRMAQATDRLAKINERLLNAQNKKDKTSKKYDDAVKASTGKLTNAINSFEKITIISTIGGFTPEAETKTATPPPVSTPPPKP
jgi:hypothetical protein